MLPAPQPTGDPDLPRHTLRVSDRARRIRLLVSPREGLVVVVPRGADLRRVPRLLRENAAWIERAMLRTSERRAHLAAAAAEPLPERIDLPGVGLSFVVRYRLGEGSSARVTQRGFELTVTGPFGDEACRVALRRWLTRSAQAYLPPMLEEVSNDQGLPFASATVRAQRTRWGSCSCSGRISLNRSLLFLRPELVRLILVHELLHTVRPDHSPKFWEMLSDRVPNTAELRREMRRAWSQVPAWAEEA